MTDSEIIEKSKNQLLNLTHRIANPLLSVRVRDFMLSVIDQKFWEIPASSSGKYHPAYSLGPGGLARHTAAAVGIGLDLLEISKLTSLDERDCVIASLILHDSCKQGVQASGNTVFEHPILAAKEWRKYMEAHMDTDINTDTICACIASHMGKWNTSKYSKVVLPVPGTKIQKFVHICDYLASRKAISVDLDFYTN